MKLKTFKQVVDFIFPIQDELLDFDYPYYAGLPCKINFKLSPEAVDAMQHVLNKKFKSKRLFAAAYEVKLFELGEEVV